MANSWPRPKRNAFGGSSIGPVCPRTPSIIVCARRNCPWREIDHIAINRKPGANNLRRLGFVVSRWPHPKLMLQKIRNIRSAASIKETLEKAYGIELKAQVHHVEHHLAHLASAFLVSGFNEAACISIDGFGDFASTAFGFGRGSEIKIDNRVYFPHSLGIFYSALTQFIGFPNYGDEYKVMGLAPYGEPTFFEQMREIVRIRPDGTFRLNLKYFRHHSDNVSYTLERLRPGSRTALPERTGRSVRAAAKTGRAARTKTQGHRPFRPDDLRESVLRVAACAAQKTSVR